ncbi:MAG: DmsE family decaheme c-type cytochrome [Acidobacteria bacterium]|nr:DmsE family decaheme c-type cytochrome [Acidobacteriota bacterium]
MKLRTIALAALALSLWLAGAGILAAQAPSQKPAVPSPGTAINNEDCAVCHEDLTAAFDKTPHAILEKSPKLQQKNSCESCHGPGEAHSVSDGDKTKIISFIGKSHDTYNRQCLACHAKNHELDGFKLGLHAKSGLSCASCHSVHKAAAATSLLRKQSNSLCMECHLDRRAEFAKPFRHRVTENAMRCTDCHQAHGGLEGRQMRASHSGEAACVQCHTDKSGPFIFEHASLRIRGCRGCHESHGSNNSRMLVRSTVRSLCLECHSTSRNVFALQPPSVHDVRSPRYQNCTTCHSRIHGSNASSLFLQ